MSRCLSAPCGGSSGTSRACRSRALGRSHDRIRGTPQERPRDPVGRSRGLQPPDHDGGQRRRHHDDRCGRLRHRTVRRAARRRQLRGHLRLRRRRPCHAGRPLPHGRLRQPAGRLPDLRAHVLDPDQRRRGVGRRPEHRRGRRLRLERAGDGDRRGRLRLPGRQDRPAGREHRVPGLRLPLPLRRVPGVRQHQLQRRVHRAAGHVVRRGRPGHADRDGTRQLRRRRG